jgi:hypothetical protein
MTGFVILTTTSGLIGQIQYLLYRTQRSESTHQQRLDKFNIFEILFCPKISGSVENND